MKRREDGTRIMGQFITVSASIKADTSSDPSPQDKALICSGRLLMGNL